MSSHIVSIYSLIFTHYLHNDSFTFVVHLNPSSLSDTSVNYFRKTTIIRITLAVVISIAIGNNCTVITWPFDSFQCTFPNRHKVFANLRLSVVQWTFIAVMTFSIYSLLSLPSECGLFNSASLPQSHIARNNTVQMWIRPTPQPFQKMPLLP